MNIDKGKISNLNKKLIAGLLAITLSAPLIGCNKVQQNYGLNHTIGSEGQYVYPNVVFDSMKHYRIVIFKCADEYSVYLTRVVSNMQEITTTYYYNAFGGQLLYWSNSRGNASDDSLIIEKEFGFDDYLIIKDEVQPEYTEQELRNIIEQIKTEHKKTKDKQLVKE